MSWNEELVDLSLFADSPTTDRQFAIFDPVSTHDDTARCDTYEYWPSLREQTEFDSPPPVYTMKPLPPVPQKRVCPGVSKPTNGEVDSRCNLTRLKNINPDEYPSNRGSTLLQRRNPTTPRLTLSAPQSSPTTRSSASAMVWMPDEQMWLITKDTIDDAPTRYSHAYPTPPAYSPRPFTRSEPSPTTYSSLDLTPPLTPLQSQLQSLIQPRDEERLSPLFQEAMNSVPMANNIDLTRPPSHYFSAHNTDLRPSTARSESFAPRLTAPESSRRTPISRSHTTDSQRSRPRARTTEECSSYANTVEDLTKEQASMKRWYRLASRIARPRSAV